MSPNSIYTRLVRQSALLAVILILTTAGGIAQSSPESLTAQHAAMQKLAFLAGRWSGPVTIAQGPGDPVQLSQSEDVQFKLDGLVLLIQGQSTDAAGKVEFQALATIAYDDATHSYRMRAYHAGHYIDTELTALPDGFSWSFPAGPAKVVNTMHLTTKGQWQETSNVAFGSNPPRQSVDMLLVHQP